MDRQYGGLNAWIVTNSYDHPVLLTIGMTLFGGAVGAGGAYLHGPGLVSGRGIIAFAVFGAIAVGSTTAYRLVRRGRD
jgi:hypothetical protein